MSEIDLIREEIYELLKQPSAAMYYYEDLIAIYTSIPEVIKLLLRDPYVDPSINNNEALLNAVYYGHIESVKILLEDPRVDPNDWTLKIINKNHVNWEKAVKMVIKDYRFTKYSETFFTALLCTIPEILELLLRDFIDKIDYTIINKFIIKRIDREIVYTILRYPQFRIWKGSSGVLEKFRKKSKLLAQVLPIDLVILILEYNNCPLSPIEIKLLFN